MLNSLMIDCKNTLEEMVALVNENGMDGMAQVFGLLLNHAMVIEREQVLQAGRYQRTESRTGYANGFKPRNFQTRMGPVALEIPQVRGEINFYPSCLEKGLRSERAFNVVLCEMYIQGVSTRKTKQVMEKLCGLEVTSIQVSRAAQALDKAIEAWRNQPIGTYKYLFVDARYEKVRIDSKVRDCAVLIAVGVNEEGKRSVLGVSCELSEAEIHWRSFFESLKERGLNGVELIISDDHAGLKAARKSVFRGTPWQRCQFHLQQNAQQYITKKALKEEVAKKIQDIFNAESREKAEEKLKKMIDEYGNSQEKLVEWLEQNLSEGFTIFDFPKEYQIKLRTTNMLERLNREIKRRTRVVGIFPNEASLIRLVGAMLMERDEAWSCQTKPYLTLDK